MSASQFSIADAYLALLESIVKGGPQRLETLRKIAEAHGDPTDRSINKLVEMGALEVVGFRYELGPAARRVLDGGTCATAGRKNG